MYHLFLHQVCLHSYSSYAKAAKAGCILLELNAQHDQTKLSGRLAHACSSLYAYQPCSRGIETHPDRVFFPFAARTISLDDHLKSYGRADEK